jgi:hypothetical protein
MAVSFPPLEGRNRYRQIALTREPPSFFELARRAARLEHPEDALVALTSLRGRIDELEAALVENALREGWSWSRIARALGVTKQAAHKKHAARVRAKRPGLERQLVTVTGHARQAVYLARQEARALGHGCVETGDLLLGLLRQRESPAATALSSLGVALSPLRDEVKSGLAEREPVRRGPGDRLPIGPRARAALEQSLREALLLRDSHLGVEHLLLALLRDERASAAYALEALGVSTEAVEERLMRARTER